MKRNIAKIILQLIINYYSSPVEQWWMKDFNNKFVDNGNWKETIDGFQVTPSEVEAYILKLLKKQADVAQRKSN